MNGSEFAIVVEDGGDRAKAFSLSEKTGAAVYDIRPDTLCVVFASDGVSLSGSGLTYKGDFSAMLKRVSNGKLSHEMLVHAAKTKTENPKAVDASAGMGEDSFLLASYGYDVTMYEQNPVIACLLADALERASSDDALGDTVSRMHLIEGNSISLMPSLTFSPEIVYLDPMFPERRKSGLINKKLQLIQKLEHPCIDEDALLDAAIAVRPKKIIIKRPLKGAYLAGRKPSYTNEGKAIRYDCFVFPENF